MLNFLMMSKKIPRVNINAYKILTPEGKNDLLKIMDHVGRHLNIKGNKIKLTVLFPALKPKDLTLELGECTEFKEFFQILVTVFRCKTKAGIEKLAEAMMKDD